LLSLFSSDVYLLCCAPTSTSLLPTLERLPIARRFLDKSYACTSLEEGH